MRVSRLRHVRWAIWLAVLAFAQARPFLAGLHAQDRGQVDGSSSIDAPLAATPNVLPPVPTEPGTGVDWSQVPPVRVIPRAGYFLIPPSGPGYYSLHEQLRGNLREKPPIQPYGAFGLYAPSFFDSDFRYLDKPDNQQFDYLDPLKRIHVGDDWLISLGGMTWWRYMNEVDSRLRPVNNTYSLFRTRAYADVWYRDCVRVYAEYIYAESFWQDLQPLPIDINRSDLLDGFVELKVCEYECKPVYVRVGRQEMLLGSQRLISTLDWANTRRTFQGVRGYRQGEKWDLDAFWVQPVIPNRNDFDSVDNDQNFFGLWLTYRPRKGTFWDLYALDLDQAKHVADGTGGQLGAFNIATLGSRFAGDYENILWDFEAMLQFGTWADQDFLAAAVTAEAGYHFKGKPLNPQVWLGYDWASGDERPGFGTTRGTFNQLFPFGHYYFGFLDLVGRQNIHDFSGQFVCYPLPWITGLAQLHHFQLSESRDALYNPAGRPIRRDPTGNAGRDVGREIDLLLSFHLSTHSDLLIGWSKLFPGRFIADSGADVSPELLYVQYGFRW